MTETRPNRARRAPLKLSYGVGRFLALIIFAVGLTGLGIYQVNRQYDLIQVGYTLNDELKEFRRLFEAKKRLELELSAYRDPNGVRRFAEDALDMKVPGATNELFVPTSHGAPTAGTGAPR